MSAPWMPIAATALLAAVLPAAASAESVAPIGRHATEHVAWAGERLLAWDDREVERLEPDGRFARRFAVDPPEDQRAEIDSLAVGGDRIAFITFGYTLEGEGGSDLAWGSLRAGPIDGPFPVRAGDERAKVGPRRHHGPQLAAVTDNGVAYVERTASGSRVVWLPDGGQPAPLGTPPAGGLHGRGRYLAISGEETIDVYDTTTGPGLVYRVRLARARAMVDADGTVAAVTADGALHTATPASPEPVKRADGARTPLGFGAGRVHYLAARGRHLHEGLAVELSSGARWAITPALPDHANGSSSVAAEGSRLAYTDQTTRCVYVGDLPATAPARWPLGRGCRPRMHSAIGDAPTRGRVEATLACPGASGDTCAGEMQVRVRRRGARRWRLQSRRRFALTGGATADYVLRVRRQRRSRHQVWIRMSGRSTATGDDVRELFF